MGEHGTAVEFHLATDKVGRVPEPVNKSHFADNPGVVVGRRARSGHVAELVPVSANVDSNCQIRLTWFDGVNGGR